MLRRPPRSTLFPHDALPISALEAPEPRLRAPRALRGRRRGDGPQSARGDRKSTRLNSSHPSISYAVFCLKKKQNKPNSRTSPTTSQRNVRTHPPPPPSCTLH